MSVSKGGMQTGRLGKDGNGGRSMRGHAETKKNEQKTEKNNEMHKNILRNCLCVLAGAAVLTIGIMAPKTILP